MKTNQSNTDQNPKQAPAPEELLTKKELAQRLRVSLRKIELDRELPKITWGRTVRYDWPEVKAYLKSQQSAA